MFRALAAKLGFKTIPIQTVDDSASLRSRYPEHEFDDYFMRERFACVVQIGSTRYFAKPCTSLHEARKQLLATNLAARYCNVSDATLPGPAMQRRLKRKLSGSIRDFGVAVHLLLVRVCQDYSVPDLKISDLTQAVAAELVLSTWINRRDAHNSNRFYVGGIPMFFDFDAAFAPDEEPTEFFRGGPDSGYVQNWRLMRVAETDRIETSSIRDMERNKPLTLHPVSHAVKFWAHMDDYAAKIRSLDDRDIEGEVAAVFPDMNHRQEFSAFLAKERDRLETKLARVRTIMETGAAV
ncbi:MAG: hypothetical protein V4661_11890 [Pseudomonadota bacterium]